MNNKFSGLERQSYLQQMASIQMDLIVIGGGITGAGIALDATKRGLCVGLIEMQDYAEGTSSRSTKLIHGGLRYLKQGEIKLVREVGREREILYTNAPHIVIPERMLLPVVEGGTFNKFATSIGLLIYDYLAGVKKHERRKMLTKNEAMLKEPLLRSDILKGAGYYVEYRTDDARLTLEVLKTAVEQGAIAVNYAKAEEFILESGNIAGVKVKDCITGETYGLKAKKVVNATGPWVDTIREIDRSKHGKRLHLTKGVHLVVDKENFPLGQAVYFDTPDKRMIFAIPRGDKVYVGTTDSDYNGPLHQLEVTEEELDYIIRCTNNMFPSILLKPIHIESSWAGLRPLIHEDGKSPSELSRKDEIILSKSNLISIAGGKLTGFRKMAQRVTDLVCAQLTAETGKPYPECTTHQIRLTGGRHGPGKSFRECYEEWIEHGQRNGIPYKRSKKIVDIYGSNSVQIFDIALERQEEAKNQGLEPEVYASLLYGIKQEMIVKPDDFLVRRTGDAYFDIEQYRKNQDKIGLIISE